jgi:hypothetical protein
MGPARTKNLEFGNGHNQVNECKCAWVLKNSMFEATLCFASGWCRLVSLFFSRWLEPLKLVVG